MILKKTDNIDTHFSWLTLVDHDPDCEKFEINDAGPECNLQSLKFLINHLFHDDFPDLVIGPCGIGTPWNDFADVVADIDNFEIPLNLDTEYDNHHEVGFMKMMVENGIEYDYRGYCKILDWNKLLDLVISVVLNVGGSESLFFYHNSGNYCFYIDGGCGVGVFFREFNDNIRKILTNASIVSGKLNYKDLRKSVNQIPKKGG